MTELTDAKHRAVLVEKFLPSVAEGQLLEHLRSGIHVCDLGSAEGTAVLLMAEAFPKSKFIGVDLSGECIEKARSESSSKRLRNVSFRNLDAVYLKDHGDLLESFDYVTAFDSIHDQTRPLDVLVNVHAMLRQGGLFSMVDIAASSDLSGNKDHPMGPFLYTVSLMHCLPVGLVDGGAGLGMMWGRQAAVKMLNQAGLEQFRYWISLMILSICTFYAGKWDNISTVTHLACSSRKSNPDGNRGYSRQVL